ncbi:MAG: hypothetical protein AB7G23_18040 [Vicinamibacterales bacterium]|nr:hypothetical protein [Acidobacteriota bacterium]
MDEIANRLAKELGEAIAAAVAEHAQVAACRARAREAGLDMRVTLEAVVGFLNRNTGATLTRVATPPRVLSPRSLEFTPNDRRFLRSLRIGAGETKEPVE